MGILITTDLEIFVHEILENSPKDLWAENIVCRLNNLNLLQDDISRKDFSSMLELIEKKLEEPRHPKNTPEQDLWCKARGISYILRNEKYREGGFVKTLGRVYTTSG